MQCVEINSVKVFFDKEKTQKNITNYNEPCGCQDCRNYYKNIEANMELYVYARTQYMIFKRRHCRKNK